MLVELIHLLYDGVAQLSEFEHEGGLLSHLLPEADLVLEDLGDG